jgi:pRiA4b ORF-3-like protein
MTADRIARLKITLDDVKPQVLRRIEVPLTIRLDRLHEVLQAALGWTNSHLYELRVQDVGWGIPDPDFADGPLDARKARLNDVLEDLGIRTLHYLYDFGDGWEHTIKIERVEDAVPGILYPRLIDAAGRCPPEDVGGPWGYEEFLAAHNDPKHERYAEFADWMEPGTFDANDVDRDALKRQVQTLAKRRARKLTVKRKPRT